MKKIIGVGFLLICSMPIFGQADKEVNLIAADSTWGQEIIKVPFWFAPEIGYTGNEDIRFATGWEDIDSNGFWSLVFAWDIDLETKPTSVFFEDNLKRYFDGLMKVVADDPNFMFPKTEVSFIENGTENGTTTFTGTVDTYDAFTTKRVIALNVTIESFYCTTSKRYLPLVKMSPKDFNHTIWEQLNEIHLQEAICAH